MTFRNHFVVNSGTRSQMAVRTCLLILLSNSLLAAESASPKATNFVVIMADDLGYGDVSCFGATYYETPHLDQMAAEGMRLTDFHSNGPVCSPTRAALLTGRYQQRAGLQEVVFADPKQNRHHGLQTSETTFAEVLNQLGYATGVVGKWHLGYEEQYNPVHHGFDDFWGYVSGNVCYQSHLDRMGIDDWWHNSTRVSEDGYTTHLVTQHAVDFIVDHQDEPFCLYVAHECVHSPFQGPNDPPVRVRGQVGDIKDAKVKDVGRAYQEMIVEMDHGIGRIVQALKNCDLDERTLVLFFSDNGATKQGSNAPWSGYKGSLSEGGHRVPFVAWQPGKILPGTTSESPAMTMDILPTLVEIAGGDRLSSADGESLVPVLYEQEELADRLMHWQYRNSWSVRDGQWKLPSDRNGADEKLFNLDADPREEVDLSEAYPQTYDRLKQAHADWNIDVARGATVQPEASAN
ncbi:Arylsulfatase precursor [Thalassoglobus neptunius]|uniref:Arylsulfatase n=1 Tax=Thalassoglobus neptunius TaxID=1938619 RepID=A0A5C5WL41_9PLAN|nr:sulfatase-like hydrolase/transferase [Thalassoglobus neptunius]TWT51504.1 Arylsulfatase precursor [Thalassoglobus neptunius]